MSWLIAIRVAAEAVAAALKEEGAIVIGSNIAGAMLVSAREPVFSAWTLHSPEADFKTEGGLVLEGVGLEPNVRTNPRSAYETALRMNDQSSHAPAIR